MYKWNQNAPTKKKRKVKNLENVKEYSRPPMCFKNLKIMSSFCKSSNTQKKEMKFSSIFTWYSLFSCFILDN